MLELQFFINDFKGVKSLLEVSPPWKIMDRISDYVDQHSKNCSGGYISPKAIIHESAIIKNSYIADGVTIYDYVNIRNSIVLDNTTIGHCSEVNNSVIMNNCSIPRFNYIGWSVIGANVRFGGCTTLASSLSLLRST